MKIATFSLAIFVGCVSVAGAFAKSSHSVSGYTRKNGTFVAPHRQTDPDKTKTNNWSQKGNVNPYTGKEGTRK